MKLITANEDIDFDEIEKQHLTAWKNVVETGLNNQIKGSSGRVRDFYGIVLKYKKTLLTGKHDQLKLAKSEIEDAKSRIPKVNYDKYKVKDRLKAIFNYPKFVNASLPKWGAYKFVQELDVSACAYCNRIFTFTMDKVDLARIYDKTKDRKVKQKILNDITSSKTRPELDHFYPKEKYPYLALALYNLVPSCHICNSNLKGSRSVDFDNLINPYADDFDDIIIIKAKLKNEADIQAEINAGKLSGTVTDHFGYNLFSGKLSSFDLAFEYRDATSLSNNVKAENHIELYALKELYEMHKDHASRIIKNAIRHGPGSARDIYKRHEGLFHSEEEARSAMIGTESDPDKINQFPLSKLAIDISRDFGI
jgi:hypothetical protein